MTVIIIIGVVIFLYWSLVPSMDRRAGIDSSRYLADQLLSSQTRKLPSVSNLEMGEIVTLYFTKSCLVGDGSISEVDRKFEMGNRAVKEFVLLQNEYHLRNEYSVKNIELDPSKGLIYHSVQTTTAVSGGGKARIRIPKSEEALYVAHSLTELPAYTGGRNEIVMKYF